MQFVEHEVYCICLRPASSSHIINIKYMCSVPIASSNSPPTRDPSGQRALTGDEKIMQEIKRLRDEMEKCMRQIKEIEEMSKKGIMLSFFQNEVLSYLKIVQYCDFVGQYALEIDHHQCLLP